MRVIVGFGFCFSLGRYLRLLVLLSLFFIQFSASVHFFSEKPLNL